MLYDKYPDAVITEEFIRQHYQDPQWEWNDIYMDNLSIDFIRQFSDILPWRFISEYKELREKDIFQFKDKLNWGVVSSYQHLSPEILNRFEEFLDYMYLGTNTNLPEDFVLAHKDKINWRVILTYQQFDGKFWKKAIKNVPSPWARDAIRQKYNFK